MLCNPIVDAYDIKIMIWHIQYRMCYQPPVYISPIAVGSLASIDPLADNTSDI